MKTVVLLPLSSSFLASRTVMECPGMRLITGSVPEVVVEEAADEVLVELPTAWPHPAADTRITITTSLKIHLLVNFLMVFWKASMNSILLI